MHFLQKRVFFLALLWIVLFHRLFTNSAVAEGRPDSNRAAIQILNSLDKNRDGKLDPIEVPQRSKSAVARLAEEADMDASKSLSIEKMISQLEKSKSDDAKDEKKLSKETKKGQRGDEGRRFRDNDETQKQSDDRRRDQAKGQVRDTNSKESDESPKSSKGFGSTTKTSNGTTSKSTQGFGAGDGAPKGQYGNGVIKYVDRLLSRHDKNKNGYLDRTEWESVRWTNDPKESDRNNDGRLSRDELCERIDKRFNRGKSTASDNDRDSSSASAKEDDASSKSTPRSGEDKVRRYAEGLLRRYDKNKSGVLEKDEWGKFRDDPNEFDRNHDGVLNVDELTAKLGGDSKSVVSDKNSSTTTDSLSRSNRNRLPRKDNERSGRWSRVKSKPRDDEERSSYKVLTAHERLPDDLSTDDRRWFIEKDTDADGQIMMAEFSKTWSATKVKEFLEYDLNNDGVIVPYEMIESEDR